MFKLDTELAKISGIGQKFLTNLDKLKIKTVKDLLWHFPFRYDDFSNIVKIADLKINQTATIRGVIKQLSTRRSWRRKFIIVEALIADDTAGIKAIWFNQPYIARILRPGLKMNFAGKVVFSKEEACLQSPAYELIGYTTQTKHTAGLIPIYPETKGLTSKGFRFLIAALLKALPPPPDFIPAEALKANMMPDLTSAIKGIHFPRDLEQAEKARRRFAFADLFLLQLLNLKNRLRLAQEKAPPLEIDDVFVSGVVQKLPFKLTAAQERSLAEILDNLKRPQPMNRLLQGDVGSGKTVVAAIAALVAARNGKQTAFMAPTEVLARQHYRTLANIFKDANIGIGLVTGSEARVFYGTDSEKKVSRGKLLDDVAAGKVNVVFGTHALIAEGKNKKPLKFSDLALAVVDEQHRFGVEQRAALIKQGKEANATTIHFLSMSATPIPRTLALAVFGDLDLSIIDELPLGRKKIITKVVSPQNRPKAYEFVRQRIRGGRQVFVICPRIESADVRNETDRRKSAWMEVKNVTEEFERLSKRVFPDLRVAMLHGRMKSAEKAQIMSDFAAGSIDILVSTSVVEVGVDVPNAAIMMVEGADRFGLAQLYQFRGRVGRSEHQSFCFLFTDSDLETTHSRLNALLTAKNGFELAEVDLKLRGPGEFIGEKQTGIPDLAMKALNNIELVRAARASAETILKKDKDLKGYPILREQLESFKKQIHLE